MQEHSVPHTVLAVCVCLCVSTEYIYCDKNKVWFLHWRSKYFNLHKSISKMFTSSLAIKGSLKRVAADADNPLPSRRESRSGSVPPVRSWACLLHPCIPTSRPDIVQLACLDKFSRMTNLKWFPTKLRSEIIVSSALSNPHYPSFKTPG